MLRLKILLQYNYIYLILLIMVLLIGCFRIYVIGYESKNNLDINVIEGRLLDYTKREGRYNLLILGKEKISANYFTEKTLELELGMIIRVTGELNEPINNTMPNNFNYKKHLNNRQIYYVMKVDDIEIIKENNNLIYYFKNLLYQRIENFKYTQGYLKTFILGDRTDLDNEMYEIYRDNGVAHLFAISGMHINLLVAFLLFFFKKFKYKYLIIILLIIFYASLTNYSASISRALIFFILMRINKNFDLNISSKNILLLTAALLILYNPLIIFDLGFQYSVVVTYGLILSTKRFKKNYFYNLLKISFYAFLFSMPITLYYFYEINLLGIINNLIFVPLISLIIYPLSLITIVFKFLEPLLALFINIMEYLNLLFNNFNLNIIIPKVNIIFYFIYYILLIIFIYSKQKKYLIMSLILILSFKLKFYLDQNTYVYFLDVGQGDSILIYNRQETILIDTGGSSRFKISNNIIRLMKSLGIVKLDLLILTHGHFDHLGDAENIINKFKVKNIMINNNEINELEQRIINIFPNVVNEYQAKLDFTIYNHYIGKDENESSIFALLKIAGYNLLFTGDAYKENELMFLKDYDGIVDIIKLGHHGSKTSSDYHFLKTLEVKEAIISSGRNNLYRHPHPDTINTLEALDIIYYNTAEKGTIKYLFRHNHYTVRHYPP